MTVKFLNSSEEWEMEKEQFLGRYDSKGKMAMQKKRGALEVAKTDNLRMMDLMAPKFASVI